MGLISKSQDCLLVGPGQPLGGGGGVGGSGGDRSLSHVMFNTTPYQSVKFQKSPCPMSLCLCLVKCYKDQTVSYITVHFMSLYSSKGYTTRGTEGIDILQMTSHSENKEINGNHVSSF